MKTEPVELRKWYIFNISRPSKTCDFDNPHTPNLSHLLDRFDYILPSFTKNLTAQHCSKFSVFIFISISTYKTNSSKNTYMTYIIEYNNLIPIIEISKTCR